MRKSDRIIRVGTRGSALARAQTQMIIKRVAELLNYPLEHIELVLINTRGDAFPSTPMKELGGKGVFIKELEHALLTNQIDLAVHSCKDMPLELTEGLEIIGLFDEGASHQDVCVTPYESWQKMPTHSRVGTSSLRRFGQMKLLRPDCEVIFLRGNVTSRLEKLKQGDFDGIILAAAGLQRLGMHITCPMFELDEMVPPFNQGLLALQARAEDDSQWLMIKENINLSLKMRMIWEREIAALFAATCQSAVGIYVDIQSHCEGAIVWIFAMNHLNDWHRAHAYCDNLEAALSWTIREFRLKTHSWSKCTLAFV